MTKPASRMLGFPAMGVPALVVSLLGAGVLAAGCLPDRIDPEELGDDPRIEPDAEAPEVPPAGFPETNINTTVLTVTRVIPGSGPFSGGNGAVVKGSGFDPTAEVFVGGRAVQIPDTEVLSGNEIGIRLPAGELGPADVRVVQGEEQAELADGYVYNALSVTPDSGSLAGGLLVEITGMDTSFEEGLSVRFGDAACTDVKVLGPARITCKTPPGEIGRVDVTVAPETGDPITAIEAFEYVETADNYNGGLGGDPIAGTLNVTVVDAILGFSVPEAFVIVGEDPDAALQGYTDERGQITLSDGEMSGPLNIHVVKECYERGSIIAFDATHVTVFLRPLLDPTCGEPGDVGLGVGRAGAFISGELIFPSSDEFAPSDWYNVPRPREDEERVTYVFTTRRSISSPNPNPTILAAGANNRIPDTTTPGSDGYPYRIFARPAALAVYALSGLENTVTGEFIPYVMGITRNLVLGPGQEMREVDIEMDITLDHSLPIALTGLPSGTSRGPTRYRVRADLDLGGEGVIVRMVNGQLLDVIQRLSAGTVFEFFGQPKLQGNLSDARYRITAGWYSSDGNSPPLTLRNVSGVGQTEDVYTIDGFLGIPQATAPKRGERIPADRTLRWTMDGIEPDVFEISIIGGDGAPAWRQIVPGEARSTPIPDLSTIEGLSDIAEGFVVWQVRAIKLTGFEYNRFEYRLLSNRYHTHRSEEVFTMLR